MPRPEPSVRSPPGPLAKTRLLVGGAAHHRVAGIKVFTDGFFGETSRCDHLDFAGGDFLCSGHSPNASKMVDMTVGQDHCNDRLLRAMRVVKLKSRFRRGYRASTVDDDQTGVSPSMIVMLAMSKLRI